MTDRVFHAELAWLGGDSAASNVLIETGDGRITSVIPDTAAPLGAKRLSGLTLPGLANTHSHVFHRAIRGHSQTGVADFWAWRGLMYEVAGRLDPDSLYRLALATYAEMALTGITVVGEFHYLHHTNDGARYDDPNALGLAVTRAANEAGVRITLLDTCYLQADIDGATLAGVQQRFGDDTFERWAERVDALAVGSMARVGAAIHSVRAVPRDALGSIRGYAQSRSLPLHVHVSEQPAENTACIGTHGCTPTQLLSDAGVWGKDTTAVHATHLTDEDIRILGSTHTTISMCCTTERDLADGVGPAIRLTRAGSPLCVGSDAHMMIDLFEEARAIELNQRLVTGIRGHLRVDELLQALTQSGAVSLGWDSGRITEGALADFVTIALDTPRTAGARAGNPLAHVVFGATSADVTCVIVGGRAIVENGEHLSVTDPGSLLDSTIESLLA